MAHTPKKTPEEAPAVGTRLSADEIYENVRVVAEEELHRPGMSLLWSSVAAGLTMGFSFLSAAYLTTLVAEPYKAAAAAAGYPVGFIFVVLARNQLFTENTLEPIIPFLNAPSRDTVRSLLLLWAVVLAGNLIGTLLFAWLVWATPVVDPDLQHALGRLAEQGTWGGFAQVGYRAVFAGWLIALMAWLISSTHATGAQVTLVWLTTAPISAFDFRHSIAGSTEAFYRVFAHSMGVADMFFGFLLPAIVGNVVGGFLFVALLNHGQVAAARKAARGSKGRVRNRSSRGA